jgi:hypothetical protein
LGNFLGLIFNKLDECGDVVGAEYAGFIQVCGPLAISFHELTLEQIIDNDVTDVTDSEGLGDADPALPIAEGGREFDVGKHII